MGAGYGSSDFLRNPLSSASVAEYTVRPKHKDAGWTSFFRIFIVIAEIGLSLIPGVGPVAAAGIGLLGATANTFLSMWEANNGGPKLSGISIGIDYAGAMLPILGSIKNATRASKAINSARTENKFYHEAKYLNESIKKETRSAVKELRAQRESFANAVGWHAKIDGELSFTKRELSSTAKNTIKRYASRQINNEERAIIELEEKSMALKANVKDIQSKMAEIAAKHKTTVDKINKQIEELKRVHKEIKNASFAARSSRKMFFRELEKMTTEDVANIAKKVYSDIFDSRRTLAFKDMMKAKNAERIAGMKNLMSKNGKIKLSQEAQNIVFETINVMKTGRSKFNKKAFEGISDDFFRNIEQLDVKFGTKNMDAINEFGKDDFIATMVETATGKQDTPVIRRLIKYTGSGRFNDRWVQPLQAIMDPNDLGRAPVEFAYKHLKRKYENKLESKIFKEANEKASKVIKKSRSLEDAIRKAGGSVILDGNYIYSIRRLTTGARGSALIVFNAAKTGGRTGKNVGGKRPIVAYCTPEEYARLAEEGSSYYWAVGQRKGWFISRGGHAVSGHGAFQNMSTRLSLFLAFVPIQSLRNVLSIVSNFVGNVSSMAKHQYFNKYWPKLERALVRSSINRTARFVTKVIAGGHFRYRKSLDAINKLNISPTKDEELYRAAIRSAVQNSGTKSMWLGRELQRYSTSTLGMFEGADKKGFFAFKSGESKQGGVGKNLFNKTVKQSLPTMVRGTALRSTSYYRGRSVDKETRIITVKGVAGRDRAKDLITAKRNFQQVGRVYSAFTPPGVPTLRKITRF